MRGVLRKSHIDQLWGGWSFFMVWAIFTSWATFWGWVCKVHFLSWYQSQAQAHPNSLLWMLSLPPSPSPLQSFVLSFPRSRFQPWHVGETHIGGANVCLVSLYDLGQSSPHELTFGVELGPKSISLSHMNYNHYNLLLRPFGLFFLDTNMVVMFCSRGKRNISLTSCFL